MKKRLRALLVALAVTGILVLAVHLRWRLLPTAAALGDAMGPWWVAARGELMATPHAPPYGWLLAACYRPLLWGAHSLWEAVTVLMLVHALAAPVAVWLLRRLGASWPAALIAGLAAAVDPGLLDTAGSGAETYLAPLLLGICAGALVGPRPRPLIVGLTFAAAVHHHPLALCAAPMLLLLPRDRRALEALAVLALVLGPQLWRLWGQPAGLEGADTSPLVAMSAWLDQEGRQAWVVVGAAVLGLGDRRSRGLSLAVLASLVVLLGVGAQTGALRDHHLRLLVLPALGGLCVLPGPWALLCLALLPLPESEELGEAWATRPGGHGLLSVVSDAVAALPAGPLVVDGVWLSRTPAVEAGAVLLDLHLRGRRELGPGGQVVLVVSGGREGLETLPPGLEEVQRGDHHRLLLGDEAEVTAWLDGLCARRWAEGRPQPRLGGAFDAMASLDPELPAARLSAWREGCEGPVVSEVAGGCPEGMVKIEGGAGVLGLARGTFAVVETAHLDEVRAPEARCAEALAAAPEARACWVQTDLVDPVLRPRRVSLPSFCVEAFPFPGEGAPYTADGMTAWDTARLDELLQTGRYGPRRLCTATEVQAAAAGLGANQPFVYGEVADPERCPPELTGVNGELSAPLIGHDPACRNAETGVHEVGAVVSHWAVADRDFLLAACEAPPCRGAGGHPLSPGAYVVMGGTGRLQTRQAPLTPHTWHDHGSPSPTGCDKMGHDDQALICATPDPSWPGGRTEEDAAWGELVALARETGSMAAVLEAGLGRELCGAESR